MPHTLTTDANKTSTTKDLIRINGKARQHDEPPHASEDQGFLTVMMAELPAGCCFFPDTLLIHVLEKDGSYSPVCGPLRVTAYLRDAKGGDWQRRIEFLDRDGRHRTVVLSERDLAGTPGIACAALSDSGLDIRGSKSVLVRMLAEWPVTGRIWTATRPGWVMVPDQPRVYVTPAGEVCTGRTQTGSLIELVNAATQSAISGTFEGWSAGVGRMSNGNPGLITAIATTLSGPLLDLAGIDTLGINLHADTSSGKSTALEAAHSCFGDPRTLNRWNASNTGLELITARANDGTLILDEFPALPDRRIVEALYAIGNGTGRIRGQHDLTLRTADRWHAALLSTSEKPISVHLAASRIAMPEGLGVRLIDIPAASWAHGLFETLHEHATPHGFATTLVAEARAHHGHVLPAFVGWLIDHEVAVRRDLPSLLQNFRSSALRKIGNPDQAPGPVMRVFERLGLIAAAGELGVAAGLLPWPRHMAWNSVLELVPLWYTSWSSRAHDDGTALLDRLKAYLADARNIPGLDVEADFPGGWQDRQWIYLDMETFANEVAGDVAPTQAARLLHRQGVLVSGNEARSLQVRLPTRFDPLNPRVYRFRRRDLD